MQKEKEKEKARKRKREREREREKARTHGDVKQECVSHLSSSRIIISCCGEWLAGTWFST